MNILIAGKGSYVGQNIKRWLEKNGEFKVDELDLLDEHWVKFDCSSYHSVIHVSAIVHRPNENIDWETYYNINSLLPKKVAELAKGAGVKQFIFLSSMAVYGQGKKLPYGNIIDFNTPLEPKSYYGKSKYEAEFLLKQLRDDNFRICIVRPPNIYGKNCMGNYFDGFVRLTKYLPIFPKAFELSKQSFLYIDNLSEFLRLQITHNTDGVFMPQDGSPISTIEFMQNIAVVLNKRIYFSRLLGVILKFFMRLNIVNKVFGGISYDISLSHFDKVDYALCSYQDAIRKSIQGD